MRMNVGCRELLVVDPVQGRVPAWVMYPTRAEGVEAVAFGAYRVEVVWEAPVEGVGLPVVVVSHGNNGSPWAYRGLAMHLASAGFVVVLVEHVGNSWRDGSLAGTRANLEARPRHLRGAVDAVVGDGALGRVVDEGRVAVVGHSMGACAALTAAGGRPAVLPHEARAGEAREAVVEADGRVRALVLLAPAAVWLAGPGALAGVGVPVLMLSGARDEVTPALHAEVVLRGVGREARVESRVVAGAGHFSFQSPFPPEMCRPGFAPAVDPPGFDRAAFAPVLAGEVEAFLRRVLG
ncbi:MAG: alpha/beta hydrolase [Myxococcales bacterium]|nr:alpha/beta hydrolase [Myxococcales bacterium]